jgi:hypothetical protein
MALPQTPAPGSLPATSKAKFNSNRLSPRLSPIPQTGDTRAGAYWVLVMTLKKSRWKGDSDKRRLFFLESMNGKDMINP